MTGFMSAFPIIGFEYVNEWPRAAVFSSAARCASLSESHDQVRPLGTSHVLELPHFRTPNSWAPASTGLAAMFSGARSMRFRPLALAI
jgi:hypothetical protein